MKKLMFGKLFISFIFVSTLIAAAFPAAASALSGAGTVGDPYQITNCAQLQEMNDDLAASYAIMNDIDCSATGGWNGGDGFLPVMGDDCTDPFTGTLDGNNHTITGLFIDHHTTYGGCAGLFGWTDGATIADLTLTNVDISATGSYAGALVGYAEGGTTITNVHSAGTVNGQGGDAGGLVGLIDNGDSITRSSSTATVTSTSSYVGGLVGYVSGGSIDQSYATGNVSTSDSYVGGLTGYNDGDVSDSYAFGNASGDDAIGGLAGYNGGTIINAYSVGMATGNSTIGGLVGSNSGVVNTSFWNTQTSGQATSDGGTGKTTVEMKDITTFTTPGWDFTTVWNIDGTNNQGYPFLRWQNFPVLTDGDGVDNAVEAAAPNAGDANNDGTPDKDQATVTSLVDPVTNKYAVLDTSGCSANNGVTVAAEDGTHTDTTYDYPGGLMDFNLTCTQGATATITMYYYGLSPTNVVLRKYNPTTHSYVTVTGAVVSGVTIGGQQATKIVYQVTDGGSLDQDGTVNGVIVDPAGPAIRAANAPNTGLQPESTVTYVTAGLISVTLIAYEVKRRIAKKVQTTTSSKQV